MQGVLSMYLLLWSATTNPALKSSEKPSINVLTLQIEKLHARMPVTG